MSPAWAGPCLRPYLNNLKALGDADLSTGDPKMFMDEGKLDLDTDGNADLRYGSAVELLSPL